MPLYDYTCTKCHFKELDVLISNPTTKRLEETYNKPCIKCRGKAEREFPLPRRPHVEWTNPEFSWKHGRYVSSTKDVDAAEKKLKEQDMEAYAKAYMQEENKAQAIAKETLPDG